MEDRFDAVHGTFDGCRIADGPVDKLGIAIQVRRHRPAVNFVSERIEDTHAMAFADQCVDKM
jgi:hypothetical protein